MSAMEAMPMPGGWTMSMTWMRMPGQTWLAAAASFVAMWIVMMTAMMLPSLVPTLSRYRRELAAIGGASLGRLSVLAGLGYFAVWSLIGAAVFPFGAALATLEMQQPAIARRVPLAASVVVLIAGLVQFSAFKARHLACCRDNASPDDAVPVSDLGALRFGLRFGLHCSCCCAGLMAILLVIGVMDLRVMALVTAAITIERFAPNGQVAARGIGVVSVAVGGWMIAQVLG
jgi:predicted metal-binding membrane protein